MTCDVMKWRRRKIVYDIHTFVISQQSSSTLNTSACACVCKLLCELDLHTLHFGINRTKQDQNPKKGFCDHVNETSDMKHNINQFALLLQHLLTHGKSCATELATLTATYIFYTKQFIPCMLQA